MRYVIIALFFFALGLIHSSYKGYRISIIQNSEGLQEAVDHNMVLTKDKVNCEYKLKQIREITNEKRH